MANATVAPDSDSSKYKDPRYIFNHSEVSKMKNLLRRYSEAHEIYTPLDDLMFRHAFKIGVKRVEKVGYETLEDYFKSVGYYQSLIMYIEGLEEFETYTD
tara:strand:+ start:219 stop:518 length:300 start_codon:yes stop_codon:yes gene_type:complete